MREKRTTTAEIEAASLSCGRIDVYKRQVLNTADTRQKLENDVFWAAGIAQKYNCSLVRLDYQQEQGLMSSLPLGASHIQIERSLTTSSVAVFVPFVTQELFQGGDAMYYGINAKTGNMIMLDRLSLIHIFAYIGKSNIG